MEDDWGDLDDPAPMPQNFGRSFSNGRGFASTALEPLNPVGDGWDDDDVLENNGVSKNNFGADDGEDKYRGGRGHRGNRVGTRSRGRGSRGGRGGYNRNTENSENFDDFGGEENLWNGRGGGRDHNTRGRGGRNNNKDSSEPEEKKHEIYIPPDPTVDENELLHSGNTTGINFTKYDNIEVKVTGENIPPPISVFSNSGLKKLILNNLEKSGYSKPTPIQKHSIPIITNSRDLMACAQTGSGKTAAFLLPIINYILENDLSVVQEGRHVEPFAVIISPTRELTIQIYEQSRRFSLSTIVRSCVLYGGTSTAHQQSQISRGCHIIVATPGRLNDFVKRGLIKFTSLKFMVLDEADRMLDMGFLPQIEEVMTHDTMPSPGERVTLMFSATFQEDVQHLAGKFLNNYIFVTVGIVGGACSDVEQIFYQVDKYSKRAKLFEILKEVGVERTLIFVETKRNADFLAVKLSNDYLTTNIHGDRLQREREIALNCFKKGSKDIMVATGVAARGLDIKDVKHVINYDLPKSIDEYVHRIGRTGRVGNRGKATSFYDASNDGNLAPDLVKILKQAEQPVPDWLQRACYGGGFYESRDFGGKDIRGENFGDAQDFNKEPAEVAEDDWD